MVINYREEDLQAGHREVLKIKTQAAGKQPSRQDIFRVAGKLKAGKFREPASQEPASSLPLCSHLPASNLRTGGERAETCRQVADAQVVR